MVEKVQVRSVGKVGVEGRMRSERNVKGWMDVVIERVHVGSYSSRLVRLMSESLSL